MKILILIIGLLLSFSSLGAVDIKEYSLAPDILKKNKRWIFPEVYVFKGGEILSHHRAYNPKIVKELIRSINKGKRYYVEPSPEKKLKQTQQILKKAKANDIKRLKEQGIVEPKRSEIIKRKWESRKASRMAPPLSLESILLDINETENKKDLLKETVLITYYDPKCGLCKKLENDLKRSKNKISKDITWLKIERDPKKLK